MLRVTRQYADVLGPGDGKARVTRQYVDVLGSADVHEGIVVDTLTLTDRAEPRGLQSVVEPLSLSHVAGRNLVRAFANAHTLEPTDAASGDRARAAFSELVLSHAAAVILNDWASDTLVVTHEAITGGAYGRPWADSLTLGQQGQCSGVFGRTTADTLSLNEVCVADLCKVAVDTLSLSAAAVAAVCKLGQDSLLLAHTVGLSKVVQPHATSIIALTHGAGGYRVRTAAVSELVDLGHTVGLRVSQQHFAANTLLLGQRATVAGPRSLAAVSVLQEQHTTFDPQTWQETVYYIGLQDAAIVAVIRNTPFSVSHQLSFAERAIGVVVHADAIAVMASDALSLTHSAAVSNTPCVSNTLALTQAAVCLASKTLAHTLATGHVASVVVARAARTTQDSLTLSHALGFVHVQGAALQQYRPFIGEGPLAAPPAACPIPVSNIGECRLCYPVAHPTEFLTLRSPEFGNKDRLQFNRISRETRGGTLRVFADTIWPKVETRALTFRGLSRLQVQDYLTFLENHLGLEVGFVDWEGFYWKGVILNPSESTVQDSRDIYTVSFEFEGEHATWEP
jgi:hypothetical protein